MEERAIDVGRPRRGWLRPTAMIVWSVFIQATVYGGLSPIGRRLTLGFDISMAVLLVLAIVYVRWRCRRLPARPTDG